MSNRKYVKVGNRNQTPKDAFESLINAIDDGNIYQVKKIVEQSTYERYRIPEYDGHIRNYIFEYAIQQNKLYIVKYLDEFYRTINLSHFIHRAIDTDDVKMLQYFLDNIVLHDDTPEYFTELYLYAQDNRISIIEDYLKRYIQTFNDAAFVHLLSTGHYSEFKICYEIQPFNLNTDENPIHVERINIPDWIYPLLNRSIWLEREIDMANYLLDHKANITNNTWENIIELFPWIDYTSAVKGNDLFFSALLLKCVDKGADPFISFDGKYLFFQKIKGNNTIFEKLLEYPKIRHWPLISNYMTLNFKYYMKAIALDQARELLEIPGFDDLIVCQIIDEAIYNGASKFEHTCDDISRMMFKNPDNIEN